MRKAAWGLLLLFSFTIPWEYSLDLGEPLGNVARIVGVVLLLATVPAVLQVGRLRTPGPLQWVVLAFYLWFCCTYFWTIEPVVTLAKMRAYFQEMVVVWLVWELAESPRDLRMLLRAYVAGAWVLVALTLANFFSLEAVANGQIRFAAYGQDPNDVARFLDLGFPLAALLIHGESRWFARLLAAGYLPLGLVAVLLTASRGGFLAAVVALVGCGFLLFRRSRRSAIVGFVSIPVLAAGLWYVVPRETFERLATIPAQVQNGGLNQRLDIWAKGWHAFVQSPLLGTGAGSFVSAAGLSVIDTAHNTPLAIVVGGGLFALFLAVGLVVLAVRSIAETTGSLQLALATALLVWGVTAMVSTVEESRTTWLLLALIAVAGRFAEEEPERLEACFPESVQKFGLRDEMEQTA